MTASDVIQNGKMLLNIDNFVGSLKYQARFYKYETKIYFIETIDNKITKFTEVKDEIQD